MQTYFADLLAFFGISGAPQTFAELKVFRVFPLGNRTCLSVPLVPQKRKRKSPLSGATAYSSSDSSKSLKDAKPTMFAM